MAEINSTTGHENEVIDVKGLKASLQKLKTDHIDKKANTNSLGTAAAKNVPASGNAGDTEVVMGNDTRLSDKRQASDVFEWAKAENKPTYTASEVGAIPTGEKGAVNGVASLDDSGKVPQSQLPSYVDDVLEYDNRASFPETGESGKIYVNKANSTSWRWSGSTYTQIKGDLVIGTTSETAADGGIANTHYNNTSNPHGVTKAQVGLDSVVNTGDSAEPTENGTSKFTTGGAYTELNKKVDKVSGKGLSTNDYTADDKKKVDNVMALENSATTTGSLALTPNILYSLGALTGALTVTLGSVVSGIPNTYMMEFDINDDAATPTNVPSFPASIVWREEPVWTTGKHYEISIRYSANTQAYYAMFVEFDTAS